MSDYEILDNFLPETEFKQLCDTVFSRHIPWYYYYPVATQDSRCDEFYFTHTMYDDGQPTSDLFNHVVPVLNDLDAKAIVRAKINMYARTEKLVKHDTHVDYNYPHRGALLFLNDNDGVTTLYDGAEIESVANRVLLFDPSKPHSSSSCTNAARRLTINFNFF